jgi:hypothetical protein
MLVFLLMLSALGGLLQSLHYGDGRGLHRLVVIILVSTLVFFVHTLKMYLVLAVQHFKSMKQLEL